MRDGVARWTMEGGDPRCLSAAGRVSDPQLSSAIEHYMYSVCRVVAPGLAGAMENSAMGREGGQGEGGRCGYG